MLTPLLWIISDILGITLHLTAGIVELILILPGAVGFVRFRDH